MKLQQLLEMPEIRKTELAPRVARPFFSEASLARNYDFIHRGTSLGGTDYWVVLKKDSSMAALGFPGQRSDGAFGMDVIGTLEFKSHNLSGLKTITAGKNVLQVGLAHIVPKHQSQGWGLYLYTSLAAAGYIVISDNLQYLGGQAIWKRLAHQSLHDNYSVYVIDQGEVRLGTDGQPVLYDGSNIDDSGLWSEDATSKYTLFVLKAS
jgi:hypothetical protein